MITGEPEKQPIPLVFAKKEPVKSGPDDGATAPSRDTFTMTATEVCKENDDED